MQIKIEKNVPLESRSRKSPFPFNKMQVGDSFVISRREQPRVQYWARKLNAKYCVRRIGKGLKIRVWKVK